MKHIPLHLVFFIVIIISSLSACNLNVGKPTSPTSLTGLTASPTATAATVTVTPTVFPPTWTTTANLFQPTETRTLPAPLASATQPFTVTPSTGTPQDTAQYSITGDAATFVSDVTVPDGTSFNPGDTFTKTWRLSNSGSTTW